MFSADVTFVAEASKEITSVDFKREKQVINYLAVLLNVRKTKSRAALITYGDRPMININFNSYANLDGFQRLVDSSTLIGGSRRIDLAITMAVQLIKRGRPEVPKIIVLLTNDRNPTSNYFKENAQPLQDIGSKVFTIAVGSGRNHRSFESYEKNPKDVMMFANFEEVLPYVPRISSYISSRKSKMPFYNIPNFALQI